MPGKKALLVISNGKSARMNGSLDRTIDELKQADVSYVLYNGIGANPLKSAVEEVQELVARMELTLLLL